LSASLAPLVGRDAHPTLANSRAVIDLDLIDVAASESLEVVRVYTLAVALQNVRDLNVIEQVGDLCQHRETKFPILQLL
jgi:hypothetical protein